MWCSTHPPKTQDDVASEDGELRATLILDEISGACVCVPFFSPYLGLPTWIDGLIDSTWRA